MLFYSLDYSYKIQSELSLENSIANRPCVVFIIPQFYILPKLIPDGIAEKNFVDKEISYTLPTSKLMIIAKSKVSNCSDKITNKVPYIHTT